MEDELKDAEHSERELEKRIFHLKTLYDLGQEIGYLRGTDEITKSLLMMVIGTFGASSGFILLCDVSRGKIETFTQRGMGRNSPDAFSQAIESGCFSELNEINDPLLLNDSSQVQKKGKFVNLLSSFHTKIWIPFVIDANLKGGIGLGDKLSGDSYTRDDQELLSTMARQGAVAIENARLQQARIEALEHSKKDLEQLNKAKSRALDHLSHELRTPLSVIQGYIRILKRKSQAQEPPLVGGEVFDSLEKNLGRLSDIQKETDKIIRSYQEMEKSARSDILEAPHPAAIEPISLYPFAQQVLEEVKEEASYRDIQITLEGAEDLTLDADPKILKQMVTGLLKNAIENTPDEGMIRVVLEQKAQWIQLKVMDFGVGITKENQRRLFDGLFHTLDTDLYTSGKPYDFGAGGKGLDLLRVKTYARRFGFDISVASQRCIHLPTDRDLCAGKISKCPHCKTREDCLNSGGSTFCLSFLVPKKN
jgi:signal transduction histidine kinase